MPPVSQSAVGTSALWIWRGTVDDPDALEGYVITPSVRDAAIRILAGLSVESRQRAFRIVGPYGAGKSAFGVFLAQLLQEHSRGPAMALLSETTEDSVDVPPWRPVIVSGRRVSFALELLRMVTSHCEEGSGTAFADLRAHAELILDREDVHDVHEVTSLIAEMAAEMRSRTGEGLLLLVDEMGRFLEYAAANIGTEDPSIFQAVAEHSGEKSGCGPCGRWIFAPQVRRLCRQHGWLDRSGMVAIFGTL